MPPAGHCSAYPLTVGYPKDCYSYFPCALDHEHGPDVANEALIPQSPPGYKGLTNNRKRNHSILVC